MSDWSPAADEPQSAQLSLRRPAEGDIEAIFEIHRDPRTRAHHPSDALARYEEAERPRETPPVVSWMSVADVDADAGRCWLDLGKPGRAAPQRSPQA